VLTSTKVHILTQKALQDEGLNYSFDICKEQLAVSQQLLGKGSFAQVFKGTLQVDVAVKRFSQVCTRAAVVRQELY
jgi:hypothetical protein